MSDVLKEIIVRPYGRSVTIIAEDSEGSVVKDTVFEKILPFPDNFNEQAILSFDVNGDKNNIKINKVKHDFSYVNHHLEKEYYVKNLQGFIDWFYEEKQAQIDAEKSLKDFIANTIQEKINEKYQIFEAELSEIKKKLIKSFEYNSEIGELKLVLEDDTDYIITGIRINKETEDKIKEVEDKIKEVEDKFKPIIMSRQSFDRYTGYVDSNDKTKIISTHVNEKVVKSWAGKTIIVVE